MRIGQGYDLHILDATRPLILGGERIPHEKGLLGHSDADVLVHAIMDALLGAAGLRDIGYYFPDTDMAYKDADSLKLLECVYQKILEAGYDIGNIDATIIAEKPKLNPHIPAMKENIARVLHIETSQLAIKATTNEKMDAVGREEAIAALAVCLLEETNGKV